MGPLHHPFFRPAITLVLAVAFLAALACGTPAEPNTIAPTETSAAASTGNPSTNNPGNDGPSGQGAQDSTSAGGVVINLPIANRDTTLTRDDLRVSRGDNVSIEFTSDEPGEIHLHGYDLTAPVSPGSTGELHFVAETAGAFAINFHVFASDGMASGQVNTNHHHASGSPSEVVSELPVSLAVTAQADANGGIDVHIATEGFRLAPEMVDQPHTPGSGHAHIYLDGVKLGRVFEPDYRIADAPPGEREVRVTLNTNDHSELVYGGKRVADTVTVTVPDVGQGSPVHDHGEHDHGESPIIAEVHLGNLEVYP